MEKPANMDLSVIIPTMNEANNIQRVVIETERVARGMNLTFEIIVVDGGSKDGTQEIARSSSEHVKVVIHGNRGYGAAMRDGFATAKGDYILTMDADCSHDPEFLENFWNARNSAEIVIGSRYVKNGKATMPVVRKVLSIALNKFFRRGLSMPWKDLSSGFRMYQAAAIKSLSLRSWDFEILQEILILGHMQGYKIVEIPIHYQPRASGSSHVRLMRFGMAYLKTFWASWRLRNSIESADYDDRAYDSIIPLQRYWQRKRCSILNEFADQQGLTLDIGCGSSRILAYPLKLVGLDIRLNKLRYGRKFSRPLVNGTIWSLPFNDRTFDCVICSEVIEHIPAGIQPFLEMRRVLKPKGVLVIGTPDYAHFTWRSIEAVYRYAAPGGYADEHITHYSLESLKQMLVDLGFRITAEKYILNSEMILRCVNENN